MFFYCYVIVAALVLASLIIICWRKVCWPNIITAAEYERLDLIYSHDEDFISEDDEIDLERIENGF